MWIASPSPSKKDDEEAEVDEHDLADGRTVLKGADGTLYDYASFEAIGKWNKADPTYVPQYAAWYLLLGDEFVDQQRSWYSVFILIERCALTARRAATRDREERL